MTNPVQPNYKVIPWSEFAERFDPAFEMPFDEFEEDLAEIRLYEPDTEGNVHFMTDLMLDDTANIVVNGNLIVGGNLEMSTEGIGGFIYVTGNVVAASIVLCGVSSMSVEGNVDVKHGIFGCYGDDGGYLSVTGETTTPVVLNNTYFNMSFGGAVNAVVIDTSYGDLDADYVEETIAEALNPELLEDGESVDTRKVWEYLQQGKVILNKALLKTSIPEAPRSDLPRAALKPMTVAEALERYPVLGDLIHSYGSETDYVMVCEGDAFYPGDLKLDFHLEEWPCPDGNNGATGIIFNGNLTVESSIVNMEGDFGPFLLVLGDVNARNIDQGGSEFYITGDCHVANVVYGYYNHGSLIVDGTIKATYLINDDHCIEGAVHPDTITINNYGDDDDFDYYPADLPKMFVKEVLDKDGEYLDSAKFIGRVNEGKKVLKPGAKPARVIVEEYIGELAESGAVLTELDLSAKKLRQFPRNVLRIESLKVLNLSNNPIAKLPEDIDRLANLEELYLDACELTELPDAIGGLKRLRVLDVSNNNVASSEEDEEYDDVDEEDNEFDDDEYDEDEEDNGFVDEEDDDEDSELEEASEAEDACEIEADSGLELPETVRDLVNLKVLKINHNKGFKLPEALVELQLEALEAYQCSDARPIEFPEIICRLTSLKRLNLGSNSFKTIPDSFVNLVNLEELVLDSSLCYLETLPELSRLPKLRVLSADGNICYTSRPHARQTLLQQFFTISTLEELRIDRHGESDEVYKSGDLEQIRKNLAFDPERFQELEARLQVDPECKSIRRGVVRDALQAKQLQGIGNLKHLKVLDLSFNTLSGLPEDFWELKELQFIDLRYNCLPRALRERVAQAYPQTKIDFRNQRVKEAENAQSETKAFQAMMKWVKKGNDKRYPATYQQAIDCYNRALEFFQTGKVTDEYNLIYLHYSKMWVYSRMGYQSPNLTAEQIERCKDWCVEQARICMDLVPANSLVWHFTDEGQFHQEVIRYASNCIAWRLYETSDAPAQLEEALAVIDRGVAFADEPATFFVRDTKVRILLKLGRKEEAYALVRRTLSVDPDFGDFQDIKNSEDYRAWAKKN